MRRMGGANPVQHILYSQAASKAGAWPLTGYDLSTSTEEEEVDGDNKNYQDATTIPTGHQDAQGMGTCEGGGGGPGEH